MADSEEKDYSNREIDRFCMDIKEMLVMIHEQVKKTNGRVTSLEAWRNRIIGAVAVITVVIVPIIITFLEKLK